VEHELRPVIWFDALTTKQLLIGGSTKKFLEEKGFEVLLTARDYDVIKGLSERLRLDTKIFGEYGEDLYEKLRQEAYRMKIATDLLSEYGERFIAGVSYPNPVEARVVYGLGRDYIVISDSPHSRHPHILSLPMAKYLVYTDCISEEAWREYVHPRLTLYPYKGFDELSWIRYLPEVFDKKFIHELGLEEKRYIVLRPEESKASYYEWGFNKDLWVKISIEAVSQGLKTVILPRYMDQRMILSKELREYVKKDLVLIPEPSKAVGPAFIKYSLLVATGGGTMAREAALLGVFGATFFPRFLDVDKCVERYGLPMRYISSHEDLIKIIKDLSKDPDKYRLKNINDILRDMNTPVDAVYNILKSLYKKDLV
jgi:predicted glycosyltransferase